MQPKQRHQNGLVAGGSDESSAALLLSGSQSGRDFFEDGEVPVNIGFRVLDGDGPLLIPPIGLSEDAAIDHGEPVVAPKVDVDLGPIAIVFDLLRIKHEGAIDSGARDIGLKPGLFHDGAIAFGEFFAELADMRVIFAGEDFAKRGEAGGHGDAIGVVGAAVEDLVLRDEVHDFAAGAESAERKAAADGFGEANHVWLDAEEFRGAAPGELRAGFDFVEDEQSAVFIAKIAEALEEAGLRKAEADVHENGFENDGGDLSGIFLEAALDAGEVVERGDFHVVERGLRNTAAAGNGIWRYGIAPVVVGLGLDADESGVVEAVVGAFEFDDFVALGGGASDADGVHGDFGAAGAEADHLDGIARANFFGELPFLIVRHAEGGAFVEFLFDSFDDRGMAVAGHERAEAEIVVNVFVAVDIVDAAAFAVFDEDGIGLVVAVVAGDSEGNAFESALVRGGGFGRALFVRGKFLA